MTRREKVGEAGSILGVLSAVLLTIASAGASHPVSWMAAFVIVVWLLIGGVDSWRIRRANRFMKHHEIKVISHVHDGGSVQVVGPRPPTARQMKAWEEFAASLRDDEEPQSE